MAVELILPALGESVTEGTVTRWLKQVGDHVSADEPVVEVSTDKVDTEVPAPAAGIITQILHEEDEIVPVGTVLALIGDPAEQVAVTEPEPTADATAEQIGPDTSAPEVLETGDTETPAPQPVPEVKVEPAEPVVATPTPRPEWVVVSPRQDPESVVTEPAVAEPEAAEPAIAEPEVAEPTAAEPAVADPAVTKPQVAEPPVAEPPVAEQTTPESDASEQEPPSAEVELPETTTLYVVPLVRKLAEELGVDLESVLGTGVGGRIRKEDVQAAADAAKRAAEQEAAKRAAREAQEREQAAATAASLTSEASNSAAESPQPTDKPTSDKPASVLMPQLHVPGTSQPLSQIQAATAERLVESQRNSAQLTATAELDLTGIEPDQRLAAIVKATAAALTTSPAVNASIENNVVTYHRQANIGIACETDFGLIVPVIHLVEAKATATIAGEIAEATQGAALGLVAPRQLTGGTFTIVDNSATGALFTSAVINQPQAATLSVGSAGQRPKVIRDAYGIDTIVVRTLAYVTLTYDRRIVSPADAGAFLEALANALA
jgi:2-oxoglutarate dehydrogenase E2 component (dihydrolipoamide succinyltransferase)